jgi:hypothetical protein
MKQTQRCLAALSLILLLSAAWLPPTRTANAQAIAAADVKLLPTALQAHGVLRCYDFKTGERLYEERLGGDATCTASLVAADGKIYCAVEEGIVHVLKAGPKLEVLAKNDLGEPCLATPAISQGVLYIRTAASLLAIGDR